MNAPGAGHDAQALPDAGKSGPEAGTPGPDAGKPSPDAGKPSPDASVCNGAVADASKCDDGLSCTADEATLDPSSCQTTCSHTSIEQAGPAEGCCPPGADANSDSDCAPSCGNGVIEAGEACDDELRCFDDCTMSLPSALVHRYRFGGSGLNAVDSIQNQNGTIAGTALSGAGEVDLNGDRQEYVDLPDGLLAQLTDATFEAWVIWRGGTIVTPSPYDSRKWQRVFDFGQAAGGKGTSYLFMTPLQESTVPHVGFKSSDGTSEVALDGVSEFPRDESVHVAVVFDDTADRLSLYINGAYVSSLATTGHLAKIVASNNWLGRSQFDVDRYFDGRIQEFRIYATALSASQIAASFANGPDP